MACDGIDPWTWNLCDILWWLFDAILQCQQNHATYVAGQTHRGPGSCHWCLHFWTKKRHKQFLLKSGETGNSKGPEAKFGSGLGRLRSTINTWNKQKLFLQNHHKSSLFDSLGSLPSKVNGTPSAGAARWAPDVRCTTRLPGLRWSKGKTCFVSKKWLK